ncbi:uncharacterized protein LY89DRAFT_593831 [Mollisia scopiformis]|uniref:Uncharacterized protein n=1 Tax=Mollisia scopiformis TaxID=149040 RepID=A0A194WW92_MOLSC|nr:uncharacterized protein LY89DRAFT_593831 [Mollisia scopiformis]KUJ11852.1 hypothetical protein LY89DRAFT_593831 [Mollisia scopiformis]
MPVKEPGSSLDAPNGAYAMGSTLLKRHKTLPHPREERMHQIYPSTPATKPRDLTIDTGTASLPSSDTSSPRTLKHASKNRIGSNGLPPTPPTHSRQSSGSQQSIIPAPKFDIPRIETPTDIPSAPSTPPNQKSPPTPDFTPPRAMPLAFRPGRPPVSERYPSSRTDSFKTAREHPDSEDDDEHSTVRPILPSARTSAAEVPQLPTPPPKRKEVGLGLGLESDEGTTTPRPKVDSSQEEFVVFDGEWASAGEEAEVTREWDDNLMRNVTVRKRPVRKLQKRRITTNFLTNEDDIVSPTVATKVLRSMPLQERIARYRIARDTANRMTSEKFPEKSVWPSAAASPESPTTQDVRRFSAMSGRSSQSTVVEAMVVDAKPTRRRTLRHTKKQLGLRDFGSDQSLLSSGPSSIVSSEPQHRLHHHMEKIPERRHQSLASNSTVVSTASSNGKSRREVLKSGAIPVVIIPERRSSTKSSRAPSLRSTSSRRTKRSMSLNSAPLSASSKFNDPGYFDSLPPRKRTMSESGGSAHSVHTIDFPPVIPARRSSLSAPTSRNTSRAGSLTAESLHAHNMIQATKQPVLPESSTTQPSADVERDLGSHSARLNVDHNGDPFFGKRLSTQVTPFSQASYETAGTMAEVSEAMAVTIFPHQNKSVLVVQQKAPTDSPPLALKTIDSAETERPTMTVNGHATSGPVTPPQPSHPMDQVDSPLRNPRSPPEPPAIKFIPPTPAAVTPGHEEDRQLGYDNYRPSSSDDQSKRTMSLMRRAFSNRRNSETAAQRPGFLSRTFSLSGHRKELVDESTQTSKGSANALYPSVADKPADGSKLHPFWRPTHFWDDLEGHQAYDDYDDDDEYGYPSADSRPIPKRTFSQKLKRTFAILPIQDDYYDYQPYPIDRRTMRRTPSGNMRVVKQRSTSSSLRRSGSDRRVYVEQRPHTGPSAERQFGYGFKEGNGGKVHTIPGLGLRVEYVGWSGMRRRMSERRREQSRQKLRATISGPKSIQSGVDDVLRRRQTSV